MVTTLYEIMGDKYIIVDILKKVKSWNLTKNIFWKYNNRIIYL